MIYYPQNDQLYFLSFEMNLVIGPVKKGRALSLISFRSIHVKPNKT